MVWRELHLMSPVSGSATQEVHEWADEGYRPLVSSGDWQLAVLNWGPAFDPTNLSVIEGYNETDEVFVLWRGRGALLVAGDAGIELMAMEPGVVYDVTRGTWHNLVATHDASWIIGKHATPICTIPRCAR